MKRYFVSFDFHTVIEAESAEAAIRKAEKALGENGFNVQWQRVDGTETENAMEASNER